MLPTLGDASWGADRLPPAWRAALRRMGKVSQTPRAPKRSHVLDVSPLRESPAFARLRAGNVISGIGGQMTIVAVGPACL